MFKEHCYLRFPDFGPSDGRYDVTRLLCVRLSQLRQSLRQNGYAERLIGSIRRECLDHVVVLGECHLRHLLLSYMKYYNGTRTHLAVDARRTPKLVLRADLPDQRAILPRYAGALPASSISNANSNESRLDATAPAFQVEPS
jgi:hypothetical protein